MLLSLAIRQLWREKNNPEFRILAFALWIAVFSVTTLTSLTDSLKAQLLGEASNLLGADVLVESSTPLDPFLVEYAGSRGMKTAFMVDFLSMIVSEDKLQLANVAVFDSAFPLRGELRVEKKDGKVESLFAPPPEGQVWCDEDLLLKLSLKLGDNIEIGYGKFVITGIILQRPVAVTNNTLLAPAVYANAMDLAAMGVLQAGSRATYRLLVSGNEVALKEFQTQFEAKHPDLDWVSAEKGRPGMTRTLKVGKRYLAVVFLIQLLLAGSAIAMCAHQYSYRQQNTVAIWRCLGATSRTIFLAQGLVLMLLALVVISTSVVLAYGASHGLLLMAKQYGLHVSGLNWHSALYGTLTGIVMLLGFALPPIARLRRIPPIQIIQSQPAVATKTSLISYVCALMALSILFVSFLGDIEIAFKLSAIIFIIGVCTFGLAYGFWMVLGVICHRGPLAWRFGASYMIRHKWQGITQWLVFSLVMMLLLLVQIIQHDFIALWQSQLPEKTPNTFLLNVQAIKLPSLKEKLKSEGLEGVTFYPIVRARMSHVNDVEVGKNEAGPKAMHRALNVTWTSVLPKDNKVIEGIDWDTVAKGAPLISVEQGFAERQGLSMNDTVRFQIGGAFVSGKIVQIRELDWGTFRPNFLVIFPPGVLENFPHTYMTSFYMPPNNSSFMVSLAKDFVETSILDIRTFIEKLRRMIDKVSFALEVLLVLVFILGVMIMYASLLSTLKERLQESAMLQVLGANKRFVGKVLLTEFGLLGLCSGLIASVMALLLAKALAGDVFGLDYPLSAKWILIGVAISTSVIILFGLIGARKVFRVSPVWMLQQVK